MELRFRTSSSVEAIGSKVDYREKGSPQSC
jgi:hypothetical protein